MPLPLPPATPRLLPNLKLLRSFLLYTLVEEDLEVCPAVWATWGDLAGQAATLESLAICIRPPNEDLGVPNANGGGAGPAGAEGAGDPAMQGGGGGGDVPARLPVFEKCEALHVTASNPRVYPEDIASMFPALRRGVFGDACSEVPPALPPMCAIAACRRLERVCLAGAPEGALFRGSLASLRGCEALRELELFRMARRVEGGQGEDGAQVRLFVGGREGERTGVIAACVKLERVCLAGAPKGALSGAAWQI